MSGKDKKLTIKIPKQIPKLRTVHKPTKAFKDKSKYNRKQKHKKEYGDES